MAYLISNRECDSTEDNLEDVESGRSFVNRRKGGKKKSSRIHHKILTCRTLTLHPSDISAISLITRRNAIQHPVPLPFPRCMLPSQHQSISRTLYPPNNSNAFDKVAGAWEALPCFLNQVSRVAGQRLHRVMTVNLHHLFHVFGFKIIVIVRVWLFSGGALLYLTNAMTIKRK